MRLLLVAMLAVAACGGGGRAKRPPATKVELPEPKTAADKILAILPTGAQIVVELDLARLRANPVVGAAFTKALGRPIDLPGDVPDPPLAIADAVVFAAYGVGTSGAATIVVIASPKEIADATRLSDNLYAMGPPEWVRQLEARATVSATKPISAPADLLLLRERSMPKGAPGASLRVTARLPFDARVSFGQQTGFEAPAQLSIWADVVDDFVIVVDADAVDPGDKVTKHATDRLEKLIRRALGSLAEEPSMRALGLTASIQRAKLSAGGSWIRTVIGVGPAHLARVVERANALLDSQGHEKPAT